MSRLTAAKKIYAMSKKLHELRGGSTYKYFRDAVNCSKKHGASPENYFVLRFFELNETERATYLTSGRSKKLDSILNLNATEAEKQKIGHKSLFNSEFKGLVNRDFIFAPSADFKKFLDFISKHREFIVKPDTGTMGRGVEKKFSNEIGDLDSFYTYCCENKILLEEVITQHEALNRINPYCINSVRINAARSSKEIKLIGACIKCGTGGKVSDNFHAGGIAYPVDLDTGIISGPGRNNTDLNEYEYHPGNKLHMLGLQIPYWKEIKNTVITGMELVPSLGYIGWDIAVTPDGPEIIEGNYSWPGGNIIQFDRVGKYPLLLSCCGE